MRQVVIGLGMVLMLGGCLGGAGPRLALSSAPRPFARPSQELPVMAWDHKPKAASWTRATLDAVAARDEVLAASIPADIADWCPGYAKASLLDRRAFWAGLISSVGRYESSWNETATGGGGRYFGIMQISPRSAAHHGCEVSDKAGLRTGEGNLQCAVQMMAVQVGRDGLVSGEAGNRGIGRDWMPLRKARTRAEMASWTRAQAYCG